MSEQSQNISMDIIHTITPFFLIVTYTSEIISSDEKYSYIASIFHVKIPICNTLNLKFFIYSTILFQLMLITCRLKRYGNRYVISVLSFKHFVYAFIKKYLMFGC